MTPSGIEPATFRFAALHCATTVPKILRCDAKFLIHFLLQSVMSENRDSHAVGTYCSMFVSSDWFYFFHVS
jgi:hypothetical protein